MSEMDDLKDQRKKLWQTMKLSHDAYMRVGLLSAKIQSRYLADKSAYEKVDHQLALIDGRRQLIPSYVSGNGKKRPPRELTYEEILLVAQQLGLVPKEEPSHETEATDEEAEDLQ